jgi:ParB/RepB/Spo0J family partition protein
MFGAVSEAELQDLAENMRKHGLQHPVEATPDGVVIVGHQRVRAARMLGWKEIDVIVRHDLAAEGEAAVERRFVEDNFVRRQLSPLSRARCIQRLMELERGQSAVSFGPTQRERLKARIAARMGLSARSVSRYLLILEAPVEVQAAFDKGDIPLTTAGKFALLSKTQQAEAARRLAAGEKPRAVAAALTAGGTAGTDPRRAFVRLVSSLKRELPVVRGQAGKVHPGRLARSAPVLREAVAALNEFVAAVVATEAESG